MRVGISPKLALRPMAGVTLLSGPIVNRVSELVMAGVQSSKFAEDLPIASAILLRRLVPQATSAMLRPRMQPSDSAIVTHARQQVWAGTHTAKSAEISEIQTALPRILTSCGTNRVRNVQDGWGWCPILRKCGGFANKKCQELPKAESSKLVKDAQLLSQIAANDVAAQSLRNQMRQIASAKKDGKVAELTTDSFDEVLGKEHLIVEFYTEWCGMCRKMEEQYQGLAHHFKGADNVLIAKVNADYSSDLVPRFEVYNYPSYLFFHKGETEKFERFDGRPNLLSLKEAVSSTQPREHEL